jgi:chorismate--pyruvate lyase
MQRNSGLTDWIASPAPSTSRLQRQWLTRQGALTHGLRQLGPLRLHVLSEKVCRASRDEAVRLGLSLGQALWQREVCMSILGIDCVVARSIAPLAATQGHWQALKRLRNRPLADILYHDRAIVRSEFAFTALRLGMPLHRLSQASAAGGLSVQARRSVFTRAGQPLLVAEAFLPAFWVIAKNTS